MSAGLNYPDNMYADHEERKARRSQQPTGAYRSTDTIQRVRVLPLVSEDLHKRIAKGSKDYGEPLSTHNGRDALWDAYEEALDLCLYLRQAIEERKPAEPERVPKWDPRWAQEQSRDGVMNDLRDYGSAFVRHEWKDGNLVVTHVPLKDVYVALPPNCDGLSARDVRAPHPMAAEEIRDHDERLSGGEDRL